MPSVGGSVVLRTLNFKFVPGSICRYFADDVCVSQKSVKVISPSKFCVSTPLILASLNQQAASHMHKKKEKGVFHGRTFTSKGCCRLIFWKTGLFWQLVRVWKLCQHHTAKEYNCFLSNSCMVHDWHPHIARKTMLLNKCSLLLRHASLSFVIVRVYPLLSFLVPSSTQFILYSRHLCRFQKSQFYEYDAWCYKNTSMNFFKESITALIFNL